MLILASAVVVLPLIPLQAVFYGGLFWWPGNAVIPATGKASFPLSEPDASIYFANREADMAEVRGIALFALILLTTGCVAVEPAPTESAPPAPPAVAVEPLPAMPEVALAPRRTWRRIPIQPGGPIADAFAASPVIRDPSGLRRTWLVMNLAEPIHMPETGGQSRSVAYLADYQCERHAWHPVQGIWFRDRNAVGEIVRDRPRGPDTLRHVRDGTLIDVLVDAACAL